MGLIQSHHAQLIGDLSFLEFLLDELDRSAEDVVAVLRDNHGSLNASIEQNELLLVIYCEGNEVVSDLLVLTRFHDGFALSLDGKGLMRSLKIVVVVQVLGNFSWRLRSYLFHEFVKNALWLDSNLVEVVVDGMEACDDSTCVIEAASLLHVIFYQLQVVFAAFFVPLAVLEAFEGHNDGSNWLRNESKEVLVEAEHFANCPFFRHADLRQILRENLWITLKRWPLEVVTVLGRVFWSVWLHGVLVEPERDVEVSIEGMFQFLAKTVAIFWVVVKLCSHSLAL